LLWLFWRWGLELFAGLDWNLHPPDLSFPRITGETHWCQTEVHTLNGWPWAGGVAQVVELSSNPSHTQEKKM
jgi:hypothetical protein